MRPPALALALVLVLVLALAALPARAAPPEHDCDRLAAHPADPNRVGPGVQWDLIDARAAIRACREAVEAWPEALRFRFQLGRALLFAKRLDEGLPYLFDVAERGYTIAYANIGGTYQYDLQNYAEALKWYRRGAAQGDVSAQTHLAELYLDGAGVERDLGEALRWYQPSAAQGYPLSLYKIGVIYGRGDASVPRDTERANAFYTQAAAKGFARAQNDLGYAFERGQGVRRNLETAAEWYRRAAEQGWALAQFNLARLHEAGDGVDRDRAEALYWYRLAAGGRDTALAQDAKRAAARVARRLERDEVAAVDRRIDAWRSLSPEESAAAVAKAYADRPLPFSGDAVEVALAEVDPAYDPAAPAVTEAGADAAYTPPGAAKTAAPGVDDAYLPPAEAPSETAAAADAAYTPPPEPGEAAPAQTAALPAASFGTYHALVIGNNAYAHVPRLLTAVDDATAVARLLREAYGFRTTVLLDATRYDILSALSELRRQLAPSDNLLIYYAGHGYLDEAVSAGYWLPVDAERDNVANWIANDDLTRAIRAIAAKHVLLVVDSCYSGTLLRDADIALPTGGEAAWLRRMAEKKARTVLTSGGVEPVVDGGGGGHSVFARAFLDALRDNRGPLLGQQLFDSIRRPVMLASDQTPEYADIRKAGHDGGDFIFLRR